MHSVSFAKAILRLQIEFKERMMELERKHQLETDTQLAALKDAHANATVQQQRLLEEARSDNHRTSAASLHAVVTIGSLRTSLRIGSCSRREIGGAASAHNRPPGRRAPTSCVVCACD